MEPLGRSTLMVGGRVLWYRLSASLIRLAVPAAPLVCPICDLMLPMAALCCSAAFSVSSS